MKPLFTDFFPVYFLFSFIELAEKGLNALGKLLGWHQIDFGGASLVEDTEDYADALDDAAGAAKKLIDGIKKLQANKSQVKSNYFPKKTYNNKDSAYLAEWDAIIAEKDAKIRELEQEIERLKKKNAGGLLSRIFNW